jgi:L-serine dehydratase
VAVLLGLSGMEPDTVEVEQIAPTLATIRSSKSIQLASQHAITFNEKEDLLFLRAPLPFHANGMRLVALDAAGQELANRVYYSVGGGFIVSDEVAADGSRQKVIAPDATVLPLPFTSGDALLQVAKREGLSIAQVMRRNEQHWRSDADIDAGLLRIWHVMQDCVKRGCRTEGILPGGFKVKRRAASLFAALTSNPEAALKDPLQVMDWVNLYALAVNEENAAGSRVVTAPTNGAAGIVPAVLHYYTRFVPGANDAGVVDFLLTAAAIGILYKENASISGAEVGCQGEVGVACSMAAAALCAVMGGTPEQVENAAEIGMEHHLGLTCDPVGGLVQIPCIERNAIASVKAINAARMALRGDGSHFVSLDKVIKTMRETGADMKTKYKETARGGLAVNIVEC